MNFQTYISEVKYFSFKLEEMALNLLLYNLKGMNVFSFKFVYRYGYAVNTGLIKKKMMLYIYAKFLYRQEMETG